MVWRDVDVQKLNSAVGFAPFGSIWCCATALRSESMANMIGTARVWEVEQLLTHAGLYDFVTKSPSMGGLAIVTTSSTPKILEAKVKLDLAMKWCTPAKTRIHKRGMLFTEVKYRVDKDYVVVNVPNNEDYESYFVAKYQGTTKATPREVYAAVVSAIGGGAWGPACFTLDEDKYDYEQDLNLVDAGFVNSSVGGRAIKASSKVKVTIDTTGATVKEVTHIQMFRSFKMQPPTVAFHNGAGYFAIVKDGVIVSLNFIG